MTKKESLTCMVNSLKSYTWHPKRKAWLAHKTVIGRISVASLPEGERYYLRLLLNHVRRPTSYEDLSLVDGITYNTFKEAVEHRGLLQADDWIIESMADDVSFQNALYP